MVGWRRRAKTTAKYAAAAFVLLLGGLSVRAATLRSRQPAAAPLADAAVAAAPVGAHLAELVRIRTVSESTAHTSGPAELAAMRDALEKAFPRVHAQLEREIVGDGALLFTWRGRATTEAPLVFCAHQDVVPVEPGTEGAWEHPPFGGDVDASFVWGRGTLDDKGPLVALLEGVEALLGEGFAPRRTIYLAFGQDEEVGGPAGANKIVDLLASRGVHAAAAFDEGNPLVRGIVPGVAGAVAPVGVAEKGYLTVKLTTEMAGGHSSTPAVSNAYLRLSRALERLADHPMPARLDGATKEFLAWTAPEMGFGSRLVLGNTWLSWPIVENVFRNAPALDASVRTTTAITVVRSGVKDNVIPRTAEAEVNFRVLPGDTTEAVLAHVRDVVADEGVKVTPNDASRTEPTRVSRADSAAFTELALAVREVFPGAVVAPALFLGASDGRKYERVADDVYRFIPFVLESDDVARIHGVNERAALSSLADAVRYYRRLLRRLAG